ncbi:alkyldihydroxyacetonephosphate synthase [Tamaricihabitans halophyticus]|uniref:Alkyldihydroxyacetonephosphate synthase n=1 Tax=Tamaricihabitans halophyticus TaxID=1262583 RepID=A0A4R2RAR7_9PSEU|nr:FAD-binding oxidoreductase [Tamaricihabitans halophyticus]TCP56515.1 alkyldihydroxyacetonephosphate synthase [Tamaricihabitans halophyticus]
MTEGIDHRLRGRWAPHGAHQDKLPARSLRWLSTRIGASEVASPGTEGEPGEPSPTTLPTAAQADLTEILGHERLTTDPAARLGRAGGLSYLDLLHQRGFGELAVPDAIALPSDAEQVQRVLECCVRHDIAVVPFGGGTSVVGGVSALRGGKAAVLALDLVGLDQLHSVDPVSRLAVFGAGTRALAAERMLRAHGLTLGHVPQSAERASIGGFAATRSAGQASSGYGRFEDMVAGLRLATPRGPWRLGVAPASAAGPDLRALALGSEGTLGVLTEVTLRVRPLPTVERYEGFVLDGWTRGQEAVRALAQAGCLAEVTRLSDSDETNVSFALRGGMRTAALRGYLRARGVREPNLLVLGWHAGSRAELARRRAVTLGVLRRFRPVRLGTAAGEAWRRGRFGGPRQRDVLLDAGVCVETLETAGFWSGLDRLRDAVRTALRTELTGHGRAPLIMCHISHAYETGASLYFTVLVPRAHGDELGQWQRAKAAACAAIAGWSDPDVGEPLGTITHHHAVGTDHAPYLEAEIGALGVDVLRQLKHTLDPTGILNPGKLLPDA